MKGELEKGRVMRSWYERKDVCGKGREGGWEGEGVVCGVGDD